MAENDESKLLRVVGVESVMMSDLEEFIEIAALHCYLENNEVFTLYNVPLEIARAIEKLNNPVSEEQLSPLNDSRESLYDVLLLLAPKLRELKNSIKRVVIDSYDTNRGVYNASIHIKINGISLRKKMIPSHAIFISLLFNKPIYVTREVLEISKMLNPLSDEYFHEEE
ncbi:MAG: bifunctional nuclease domain-containing protein [Desulfurococcaceae archaeon TW002]